MQCHACQTELEPESKFCPKCGARLNGEEATAAARFAKRVHETTDSSGDDDQEQVLWEGGYSAKAMIGSWLLGTVLSVAAIVAGFLVAPLLIMLIVAAAIWLVLALILAYKKLSVRYELSTQRFMHRSGILRQTSDRIEVIDIDDVTYVQGLVQRMLGVGTIKISSSDRTHPELQLHGIDEVQRVADLMDDARRKERRRRGLHIEAV